MNKSPIPPHERDDDLMHVGHRERMRSKLFQFGRDVFHTYELLEMILYYVIPYKDTNPIAHRLLEHFGSLDAIFEADVGELCRVNGVGERTARFLIMVGKCGREAFFPERAPQRRMCFRDVGEHFVRELGSLSHSETHVMMLDNHMSLIACERVFDGDFSDFLNPARVIIPLALRLGASVVLLAHNHPHGPLYETERDHNAVGWLRSDMANAGVLLAEHYIISGDRYIGTVGRADGFMMTESPELSDFFEGGESRG